MKIKYPVRCQIVDVFGGSMGNLEINTPEVSKPHIGKFGLAERISSSVVKITLDDGNMLYGYECWWIPVIQEVN
jgi:hypothetical protein